MCNPRYLNSEDHLVPFRQYQQHIEPLPRDCKQMEVHECYYLYLVAWMTCPKLCPF